MYRRTFDNQIHLCALMLDASGSFLSHHETVYAFMSVAPKTEAGLSTHPGQQTNEERLTTRLLQGAYRSIGRWCPRCFNTVIHQSVVCIYHVLHSAHAFTSQYLRLLQILMTDKAHSHMNAHANIAAEQAIMFCMTVPADSRSGHPAHRVALCSPPILT